MKDPVALLFGPGGPGGQWLPCAISFGTSMLPFLKPGEEVWYKPVKADSIRPGDVVSYQTGPDGLVTHRVLKVVGHPGGQAFLTKGDNRPGWDPLVRSDQVVGRVTRVGKRNLESPRWRLLGRLMAGLSYGQGLAYLTFKNSRLNRIRHTLERRKLLPPLRLRRGFQALSSPAAWAARGVQGLRVSRGRRRLSRAGIRIASWSPGQVEQMTQVWNMVFPAYPTTPERLSSRLCGSVWFQPSGCFMVTRSSKLLGWAFATLRSEGGRRGFIEVVALTEEGWRTGAHQALLPALLTWLKKQGAEWISTGPFRMPDHPRGISWSSLLAVFADHGFQPKELGFELTLGRDHYRPVAGCPSGEVDIRPWRAGDDPGLQDLLLRNGHGRIESAYRRFRDRSAERTGVLVAAIGGRPVGFCRWLADGQVLDYGDFSWIWAISKPAVPKGYLFHLVVDAAQRRRGIGAALAVAGFDAIFRAGCWEIGGYVTKDEFYERFGFRRRSAFLTLDRRLGG